MNMNPALIDEAFAVFHILRRDILQQLQSVFRVAGQCAQRDGNWQSNHTGTRNAHTHGIFHHVGTQEGFNLSGFLL